MGNKEINCYNCAHFSEFIEPRKCDEYLVIYGYSETVYGYCFKHLSQGRDGYKVYLPEGHCKQHISKKDKEKNQ